jgi:protein SCO1/2
MNCRRDHTISEMGVCSMQSNRWSTLFAVAGACMFLISCRSEPSQKAGSQQQSESQQQYDLRGEVVGVDKDRHQVIIAHEAIEGYMEAMTMPFNVKDQWAMDSLAPGKRVQATLVVQGDRSWLEHIIIYEGKSSGSTGFAFSAPKPGIKIPDFELLNQDGKPIHLRQYQGRPLLLTFIYTRCPLPDYCPLMSFNFAAIHQRVQSMPPSDRTPHLLSISFDYEYDTPQVLRKYAQRYMNPLDFQNWEFATGSSDQIKKITGYFGLILRKENNQIVHSLVTALIGPDGKLVHLYLHNDWKPEEVLTRLKLD